MEKMCFKMGQTSFQMGHMFFRWDKKWEMFILDGINVFSDGTKHGKFCFQMGQMCFQIGQSPTNVFSDGKNVFSDGTNTFSDGTKHGLFVATLGPKQHSGLTMVTLLQ